MVINEQLAYTVEELNEILAAAKALRYAIMGVDTRLSGMLDLRDVQNNPAALQRIAALRIALESGCSNMAALKKSVELFKEGVGA